MRIAVEMEMGVYDLVSKEWNVNGEVMRKAAGTVVANTLEVLCIQMMLNSTSAVIVCDWNVGHLSFVMTAMSEQWKYDVKSHSACVVVAMPSRWARTSVL